MHDAREELLQRLLDEIRARATREPRRLVEDFARVVGETKGGGRGRGGVFHGGTTSD
jgi:hypothetical protein